MIHKENWSQSNEQEIIDEIFTGWNINVGTALEIGGGDDGMYLSNTHFLRDNGWRVVQVDGRSRSCLVHRCVVTTNNIASLLKELEVPTDVELISWDTDGLDYYFIKAIVAAGYKPKLWLTEINPNYPQHEALSVPYDEGFVFDGVSDYHGATTAAIAYALGNNWKLLGFSKHKINVFWARSDMPDIVVPSLTPGYPPQWQAHLPHASKRLRPICE